MQPFYVVFEEQIFRAVFFKPAAVSESIADESSESEPNTNAAGQMTKTMNRKTYIWGLQRWGGAEQSWVIQ